MTLMIVPDDATRVDMLAVRYRAAFDKTQSGREQWIEGTLELAVVIAEVKRRPETSSPTNFGRWLERNGLKPISDQNRSALNKFAEDLAYARQLLEQSTSVSWEKIWKDRPDRPQKAPSTNRKGLLQDTSAKRQGNASGSRKRSRRNRIPTVMQEDYEPSPRPERKAVVSLGGLTREQVDPDFQGTAVEFATKYGHVNLHTKSEIEHHKRQEGLSVWLGTMTDLEKAGRAMVAALDAVDPDTLREWRSKPIKAAKLEAWINNIALACEKLRGAS